MTYHNLTAPLSAGRGATALLRDWRAAQAKRRLYRRTLRELNDLSDRELNDLGLSRSSVRAAAHGAVYG